MVTIRETYLQQLGPQERESGGRISSLTMCDQKPAFTIYRISEVKSLSHVLLIVTPWTVAYQVFRPWDFPGNQFSSVQWLSCVRLFATPWIAARQASLSITNSWSSPRPTSIESVMPSSHLILCRPLLLLPPIPPSIRVFSNESTLRMKWPKLEFQLQHHSLQRNPRADLLQSNY